MLDELPHGVGRTDQIIVAVHSDVVPAMRVSAEGLGEASRIELVGRPETRERAGDATEQVKYDALSKGLSFKVTMGNVVTLTPPLTITQAEMDAAPDILDQCIWVVERKPSGAI